MWVWYAEHAEHAEDDEDDDHLGASLCLIQVAMVNWLPRSWSRRSSGTTTPWDPSNSYTGPASLPSSTFNIRSKIGRLQSPWSRRARASDWSSREATQQQHLMPHTSFAGSPSWKVKVNRKWKYLFWLQVWKVKVEGMESEIWVFCIFFLGIVLQSLLHLFSEAEFESESDIFSWEWKVNVSLWFWEWKVNVIFMSCAYIFVKVSFCQTLLPLPSQIKGLRWSK